MTWAGWTDDNVALLKKLHTEGLSAPQIAKSLGAPSRNAVIGKLDRLKIKRTALGVSVSRSLAPLNSTQRAATRPVLKVAGNNMVFEACRPGNEATEIPELTGGRTILDPGFGGCRWPIGGEGAAMRFCCAESDGAPYCEDHARKAYMPQAQGKKRDANELIRSLRRYA